MVFEHKLSEMGTYLGHTTELNIEIEKIKPMNIYVNRTSFGVGYVFLATNGKYYFLNEKDIQRSIPLVKGEEYALCFKEDDESSDFAYYLVEAEKLRTPMPKIGDQVYIGNSFYIGRGEDDVLGGMATIKKVIVNNQSREYNRIFVTLKEVSGHEYNYRCLLENQEEYKKRHGDKQAKNDPDYSTSYYW